MNRPVLTALVFVIGCAAGGVVSQLAVPPVRAGTNPTRWEYSCTYAKEKIDETLNASGAQGWELVSAFPHHLEHQMNSDLTARDYGFCFKRALP